MSNVLTWRIFQSRHARRLLFGSALCVVLGSCILYALAKRQRVPDWPIDPDYHWTRDLDLTYVAANPENALTVSGIYYTNGEFYASCAFRNTDANHTALVRGVVGSYGRFWPKVALEVTSEFPPRWNRIGESPNISGKTETKAVAPGQVIGVNVDLDPYRVLIRKYRYGQLVTETGASAIFELKDILPPCEKWPPGMDCLPEGPSPELFPISESESGE